MTSLSVFDRGDDSRWRERFRNARIAHLVQKQPGRARAVPPKFESVAISLELVYNPVEELIEGVGVCGVLLPKQLVMLTRDYPTYSLPCPQIELHSNMDSGAGFLVVNFV